MAKRIIVVDDAGVVALAFSARHMDAAEEESHAAAFAHENVELLRAAYPGREFFAFWISVRRGEDEPLLHGLTHRLIAELKRLPDGGVECLDVALRTGEAVETAGGLRFGGGATYSMTVAKPARVDPEHARRRSEERLARAREVLPSAGRAARELLPGLRLQAGRP